MSSAACILPLPPSQLSHLLPYPRFFQQEIPSKQASLLNLYSSSPQCQAVPGSWALSRFTSSPFSMNIFRSIVPDAWWENPDTASLEDANPLTKTWSQIWETDRLYIFFHHPIMGCLSGSVWETTASQKSNVESMDSKDSSIRGWWKIPP